MLYMDVMKMDGKNIKVVAISDLHGYLPEIPECDLLCICGDLVPLNVQANSRKTRKWLTEEFKPWCESLPCHKVLFIAGNHDLHFENLDFMKAQFPKDDKVTYLFNEEYSYQSKNGKIYSIFGTPYCQIFGNWAFMLPSKELEKAYSKIPENLDILMTHDAPFGISDILLQKEYYTGEHIGNKPLAKAILQKAPKIVCHGHLHSTSREFEELGYSKVVNCSIKDEYYNPIYDPIVFKL